MTKKRVPPLPFWEHDFPRKERLAISHASPFALSPPLARDPRHGWTDRQWELTHRWGFECKDFQGIMKTTSELVLFRGFRLLFFLPGIYYMASHVRAVQQHCDEIRMIDTRECVDLGEDEKHAKADLLLVQDITTLYSLAIRSPWLARLIHIVEGQPHDEDWVYFLQSPDAVKSKLANN
jgi:hypothetical protein